MSKDNYEGKRKCKNKKINKDNNNYCDDSKALACIARQ